MVSVVRQRLRSAGVRLRSAWLQILQTAVAACVAWFVAVLKGCLADLVSRLRAPPHLHLYPVQK